MQKIIFGIFAHPDDEAFGPCGTLLTEIRSGAELHLITLTSGAGAHSMNPDNVSDLGKTRLEEWHASTELLGATSTHHLGYSDGTLGNNDHIEIAKQLEVIVRKTVEGRDDISVEFITFDLNGLTGHIDHIVASRSACLAFYRLRKGLHSMKRIHLYCLPKEHYPAADTGFAFMEAGRTKAEIDEIVDARAFVDDIHAVMRCHRSQRVDCDSQIAKLGDDVALDHFIVRN